MRGSRRDQRTAPGADPAAAQLGRAVSNRGAAAVLALQRSMGNAGVGRMLARDPTATPAPAPAAVPKKPPKAWENEQLRKDVFPGRDEMLKKFVAMFREVEEQRIPDPAERKKKRESWAPLDSQANVLGEINRLFDEGVAPSWLRDVVIDYSGMRYWIELPKVKGQRGKGNAHRTYYNPVKLVYLIKREEGAWASARAEEDAQAMQAYEKQKTVWDAANRSTRGRAPAKPKPVKSSAAERDWLKKRPEDAMAELEAMKAAGTIPPWAWHDIVRFSELRNVHATEGWEKAHPSKPAKATEPVDKKWAKLIDAWQNEYLPGFGWGATAWRTEMTNRNEAVTTAMHCNELSEAVMTARGINIGGGGLSGNAELVRKNGEYFKQVESVADFKPGASLFWVQTSHWEPDPLGDRSNQVIWADGVEFPMPFPPEFKKEWADWAASEAGKQYTKDMAKHKRDEAAHRVAHASWKRKADAAKKAGKPVPPNEPKAPVAPTGQPTYTRRWLPKDGVDPVDGWTYNCKPGQPIWREKEIDGKKVKYWMRWQHQATVMHVMPNDRLFVIETTNTREGSDGNRGVSGFTEHTVKRLKEQRAFVGYIPGKGETAAPRPAPPAQQPNSTPAPVIDERPGPYPNSSPAPWYTPPPQPFGVPVRPR